MIPINKLTSIISILCACMFTCTDPNDGSGQDEPLPLVKDTFKNMAVNISSEPDSVHGELPISIKTQCLPLFSGTGIFTLRAEGMADQASIVVTSPVSDTLVRDLQFPSLISVPVEFVSNDTFTIEWRLIPLTAVPYSFSAWSVFDSLFIQDSSELYNYSMDLIHAEGLVYQQLHATSNTIILR